MATDNHANISSGAAAEADTFNTPLGTLDAAIGDRSNLAGSSPSIVAALGDVSGLNGSPSTVLAALTGLWTEIGDLSGFTNNPATFVTAIQNYAYGGANAHSKLLIAWTEAESYQPVTVTYHGTYEYTVSTMTVKWPDGAGGTFTTDTINATWEGIDAYHITHNGSSQTITQAAVTRNGDGNVTAKPNLTVA